MTVSSQAVQIQNVPALPQLGAAMPSSQLGARREWLMAGRDLEL